ncbi:MAG: CaiB/BaiF CoA-transferase family protein [Proteobacteria bacterium]|nr:CaiB/BaiF CoA-transferase family protein [Pseudomonadota bacterium]
MEDDLPFEGVKVLDLSQGVAAPYCGMMLARNGADVIKLEPPGTGCWSRQLGKPKGDHTAHSVVVHRGKRSVGVNLKTAEGLEIAQKLAAECDVFLQNYRVGKIDKFGLDYESLKKVNPSVIYLSVTGFGNEGPRRDQPATDSVMQAFTGMMSINRDVNGLPQRMNMLTIDFGTGLYCFQAVAAALYRRAMKGGGKHIQTSLLESSLVFQEAAMMESYLQDGDVEPIGMPVGTFKTKDGYMSINARRDPHFRALCKLLGKEEWIDDPKYSVVRERVKNREELLGIIRPIIETKTSDEWNKAISAIDVLNAKVHTHLDLFEDEQVKAMNAVHWIENDTLGQVPMATIAGQPLPQDGHRLTHSPHLGEHNDAILAEIGYSSAEIDALKAKGVVGGFYTKAAAE